MRVQLLGILTVAALAVGCNDHQSPSAPTRPSSSSMGGSAPVSGPANGGTAAAGTAARPNAIQGSLERIVSMMDACDPATFNAAIGPGTCVRAGGVRFENFTELLQRHGTIGSWHFAPGRTTVKTGETFVAINRGGEVHTFTEVAAFGGGIVPLLNQLTGNQTVAPECAALEEDDIVAPGGTYREEIHETGQLKFQCCIHPWMRLEARATAR